MPLATVTYNPETIDAAFGLDSFLQELADVLKITVAAELGRKDNKAAELTPDDVSVRFSERHRLDTGDYDLEIIILAHDAADRKERLKEHQEVLLNQLVEVERLCEGLKAYVWILLAPGSFGEHDGK